MSTKRMKYRTTASNCFFAILVLLSACQSKSEHDHAVTPITTPDFILTLPDSVFELNEGIPWQHIDPFPMKLMEPQKPLPPFNEVSSEHP